MSKKIQFFIFPYAGGSAVSLKLFIDMIYEEVDVVAVEYPGRGSRSKENFLNSFSDMIEDAADFCCNHRDDRLPYALMGYSMGSIIAYEIMIRGGIIGDLKHFFAAAEISPKYRSEEFCSIGILTDEMIIERMNGFGGIDSALLKNPRFSSIFLKPAISDYKHLLSYRFNNTNKKVSVNASFLYSEKDTGIDKVKKWEELLDGSFDYHEMGHDHFFINRHYGEMAEIVNEHLKKYI